MGKEAIGVEISDDTGFYAVFPSLNQAIKECGISSISALKYALDGRGWIVRRSDRKVFYVRRAGQYAGLAFGPSNRPW